MIKFDAYTPWYNENEGRAYPIKESATQLTDDGILLPTNIVVDMGVLVPETYCNPYISSIRVSSDMISIAVCDSGYALVAGTYLWNNISPYRSYPMQPLMDNASGWITFGSYTVAAGTIEHYRFGTAIQSGLECRVVNVIEPLPVTKISRLGGSALQYASGLVKLTGGTGVIVERVGNDVVIRCDAATQQAMAPTCAQVASEVGCGVPPIRSINGVCADANGKITIRFE